MPGGPTATDAECLDVLHKASCGSLLTRASNGLDTVIGEEGVKVSGGEKQRLSIARALLRRPHLLVFGTHAQLLEEKGLYYAMWRQQIGEKRTAPVAVPPRTFALA